MKLIPITRRINLPGHGPHNRYGTMIHTTGDGPPSRAHKRQTSPLQEALDYYTKVSTGPHFVVGPEGRIVQLRSTREVAWHCKQPGDDRDAYFDGTWEAKVGPKLAAWWHSRWPGYLSPAHLYPSRYPNEDYFGIEVVPAGTWVAGKWQHLWGTSGPGRY